MSSEEFKDKMLLAIHGDLANVRGTVAEVRTDLKEHMRRTAILESKTTSLERYVYMAHGAMIAIAAIWGVVKYLL